jgi:trans-aconitate methyltransferase
VVELGCGEGGLPALLPPGSFCGYHGVDISEVAVSRARVRGMANCTFSAGRLEQWTAEPGMNLIVAEEVLYYLAPADRRALLARSLMALAPGGALIAVVHDAELHAGTLADVRAAGRVLLDRRQGGRCYLVIESAA